MLSYFYVFALILIELEEIMLLDAELKKVAETDLEKSYERLNQLIAKVAQNVLPGRQFDSENARLEVFSGTFPCIMAAKVLNLIGIQQRS